MLPRRHRLTRPDDFRRVLRSGRRSGRRRLVVHLLASSTGIDTPSRAGLVVGRGVGNSVVRHRVSRRLRHLLAPRLELLSPGTDLVVRALGPAGPASSVELGADLDAALSRLGVHGGDTGCQEIRSRGEKR